MSIQEIIATQGQLVHTIIAGKIVTIYHGIIMEHSTDVEDLYSAQLGYCKDGITDPYDIHDINDFIGINFHLIQQTGGRMTYNGKFIQPSRISQTDGNSLSFTEEFYYDNTPMNIFYLKGLMRV